MRDKLPYYEKLALQKTTIQLNQNQFDAMVSLCWNSGVLENWFVNHINKGTMTELIWSNYRIKDRKGNILNGLIKRRKEEFNLFKT